MCRGGGLVVRREGCEGVWFVWSQNQGFLFFVQGIGLIRQVY